MYDYLKVFILSMIPISELRGAIPFGYSLGLPLWEVTVIAIVGNMIIVPVLLLITEPLFKYLKTLNVFRHHVERYEDRAAKKLHSYRKYRFIGLLLLVGIPIPTTGVYTGVVASRVLNMSFKVSLMANVLGVLMSGTIVHFITKGVIHLW
ncbi:MULTISPECIES: small multi-drug export protein [unclassified Fusibacter]|uniref:COG2426 family protein n=1 Tax=unclassified Fusibacter TaxID=2624464 RepID=UPI00101304B8|nr:MULTISPECIES: small multi-drug export protein [unclassified Fusibacter]MCK8059895.1 small multi-drug export protein [Fusibacter sp. A2]NPE23893.1 small multi-drug export protein [Fusibacter sp. A1]RXV58473.1 hypothetical protein DWB64_19090 [Fusibacter sp. A1]